MSSFGRLAREWQWLSESRKRLHASNRTHRLPPSLHKCLKSLRLKPATSSDGRHHLYRKPPMIPAEIRGLLGLRSKLCPTIVYERITFCSNKRKRKPVECGIYSTHEARRWTPTSVANKVMRFANNFPGVQEIIIKYYASFTQVPSHHNVNEYIFRILHKYTICRINVLSSGRWRSSAQSVLRVQYVWYSCSGSSYR